MNVTMEFDKADLAKLRDSFRRAPSIVIGETRKWVNRTAARTEREGVKEAPVIKGQLKGSIQSQFAKQGLQAEVRPTAKHALWVHEGTGIYGPKKAPIRPTRKKVLAFEIGGKQVFAKSIKGQKPNRFMKRAYNTVKPIAEADANKTLERIIKSI